MSKTPGITWYQTKERIYINLGFNIQNSKIRDYKLNVSKDDLQFTYLDYNISTNLLHDVNLIDSNDNGRNIKIVLEKETNDDETFWNYLTKDVSFNKSHVKVDWHNWVDEDEDEYNQDSQEVPNEDGVSLSMEEMMAMGGPGGPAMGDPGMGGMGGPGGIDIEQLMKMGKLGDMAGLEGLENLTNGDNKCGSDCGGGDCCEVEEVDDEVSEK